MRVIPFLLLGLLAAACGRGAGDEASSAAQAAVTVPGGDATRGADALDAYACGGCHIIPGVPDASSTLGPSLADIGRRRELAGGLPNTPDNLMRWIRSPQQIAPGSGMPDLGVTDEDARHMAAYLYTLR